MVKKKVVEFNLKNGVTLTIDPENPRQFFLDFIEKYLKPYYKESNDWNKTLSSSIREMERVSVILHISKGDLILRFLEEIENKLAVDIQELPGVNKIEILFESIDDIVQNISKIVKEGGTPVETRLKVAHLVEKLNLFEISELLIHFSKAS